MFSWFSYVLWQPNNTNSRTIEIAVQKGRIYYYKICMHSIVLISTFLLVSPWSEWVWSLNRSVQVFSVIIDLCVFCTFFWKSADLALSLLQVCISYRYNILIGSCVSSHLNITIYWKKRWQLARQSLYFGLPVWKLEVLTEAGSGATRCYWRWDFRFTSSWNHTDACARYKCCLWRRRWRFNWLLLKWLRLLLLWYTTPAGALSPMRWRWWIDTCNCAHCLIATVSR